MFEMFYQEKCNGDLFAYAEYGRENILCSIIYNQSIEQNKVFSSVFIPFFISTECTGYEFSKVVEKITVHCSS